MQPTDVNFKSKGTLLLALVLLIATPAFPQGTQIERAAPRRQVLVSIPDRKLAVLQDGEVIRIFPVAVGARVSPSPTGEFEIVNRVVNPSYYHAGQVIPPGNHNPIGKRWVGLNKKGYGIHGSNAPGSIGKASSHGCIRLRNRDMEQFFGMVRVGDTVEIRGPRDQLIAQILRGNLEATTATPPQAHPTVPTDGGPQGRKFKTDF